MINDERGDQTGEGDARWPSPETWGNLDVPERSEPVADGDPASGAVGVLGHDGPWIEESDSWRHDASSASARLVTPFSWTDGVALLAWFFLANVLVGIAFAVGGANLLDPGGTMIATFAVVTFLTVLAGTYGWLRTRDAWTWHLLGPVKPAAHHVAVGIGAGLVGWVGFTMYVAALMTVLDPEELPAQETLERIVTADGLGVALAVLGIVVLPGIVEELIYRGVFFQALRRRIGLVAAIVISSTVFGFMHFELLLGGTLGLTLAGLIPMTGIALIGAWFAWLLHRTGSLLTAIIAHASFNAVALALAFTAA